MKIGRVYANFQEDFLYTEHYLAKELAKDGHETVFITSDKYLSSWDKYLKTKLPAGHYKRDYYSVVRLSAFAPLEKVIYRNPFTLWRLLFGSGFDVLHLNAVGSFSTLMVLWMVRLKGKYAPPVVISDHSDTRTHSREGRFANLYYAFFKWHLSYLQKHIKCIVTFGEIGIKVLSTRFDLPVDFFQPIPLGYNQDVYHYQPDVKNQEEKLVIGYAGKIARNKRVDYLIRLLETFHLKNNLRLEIVGVKDGDTYCEELRQQAQDANLEITLKPFATSAELATFYNYIDLAIYPGGISITTIEASGCGTPVIIYRSIEGLESRVEKGRGVLFSNDEELKAALQTYLELYQQQGFDNARISQVTQATSSWRTIKNEYLTLYHSVL
mgnify:CR=1 FL=1